MDLELKLHGIKQDIEQWIMSFLSVNSSEFGNMPPCPFARSAWLNGQVSVRLGGAPFDDLANLTWDDSLSVVVLAYEADYMHHEDFAQMVSSANESLILKDLWALEDHPKARETVGSVTLNQGDHALIFVQKRSALTLARASLSRSDYYKNWDPEYYRAVIGTI